METDSVYDQNFASKEEICSKSFPNKSNAHDSVDNRTFKSSLDEIEAENSVDLGEYDGISKKQRKRIQKKEKWLKTRNLKRAKEKEKLKQKKQIAIQNNVKLGPSRKELKCNKMSTSNCKVHVVIDLSFNNLMNDKDLGKCVKQIHHCYSVNRRFPNPMQFYLTSFGGRFEEDMKKHDGFRNWDINFSSEHFTKLFGVDRLVYLTSDSENIITNLEDDKVYIIGGLVDHNSQKGMCLRIATEAGISHGQLPIGEFLQMSTRKTLTVDHVFEVMHGVCHGKTWEEALLEVIPARKGAQTKGRGGNGERDVRGSCEGIQSLSESVNGCREEREDEGDSQDKPETIPENSNAIKVHEIN